MLRIAARADRLSLCQSALADTGTKAGPPTARHLAELQISRSSPPGRTNSFHSPCVSVARFFLRGATRFTGRMDRRLQETRHVSLTARGLREWALSGAQLAGGTALSELVERQLLPGASRHATHRIYVLRVPPRGEFDVSEQIIESSGLFRRLGFSRWRCSCQTRQPYGSERPVLARRS